jgi:hypothetical protein
MSGSLLLAPLLALWSCWRPPCQGEQPPSQPELLLARRSLREPLAAHLYCGASLFWLDMRMSLTARLVLAVAGLSLAAAVAACGTITYSQKPPSSVMVAFAGNLPGCG